MNMRMSLSLLPSFPSRRGPRNGLRSLLLGLAGSATLFAAAAQAQLSNQIGFETCSSGARLGEVACAGIATLSTPSGAPIAVTFDGRFGTTGSVGLYSNAEPVTITFSPTVSEVRLDMLAPDTGAELEAFNASGGSLGTVPVGVSAGASPVQFASAGIARIEVRNPAGEFGLDALQTTPEGTLPGCPVGRDGCSTASCSVGYRVGGNLAGLPAAESVVLQLNGGDDLALSANGAFQFSSQLVDSSAYTVSVLTPPASRTCSVQNGSGTIGSADVSDVVVDCSARYSVGGTLSGLAPGNTVTLTNNGGDALVVAANGGFTFATPVADLGAYSVAVSAQPTSPNQTCSVTAGSGNVAGGPVTSVSVDCVTDSYTVGGTLSGLAAGSSVTLTNNGGDALTLNSNGGFAFATPIPDLGAYSVAVSVQPSSPSQTCSVSAGSGSLAGGPITTVSVACTTNSFTVGGTLSGLASGNSVTLTNNGGDALTLSGNGAFTFSTPIADFGPYAVAVSVQPTSPNQTCTVSAGAGNVAGGPVTTVNVACVTGTYTVGGSLSGLAPGNTVTLTNNGGDALTLNSNGAFTFATPIADLGAYAVAVSIQPTSPNQTCSVSAGAGNVAGGPVTTVSVDCVTDRHTIGGTLSGLVAGNSVVLRNNGGDDLSLTADGAFTFPTAIADGSVYAVTVATQPSAPNQVCSVNNGSGVLAGANVTTVAVQCAQPAVVPDPPTQVQLQFNGQTAIVTWTAPLNDGGSPITAYTATLQPGGLSCTVTGTPPATQCQISGVAPGVQYTVSVVPSNAVGSGGAGTASGSAGPGGMQPTVIPADQHWALLLLGLALLLIGARSLPIRP